MPSLYYPHLYLPFQLPASQPFVPQSLSLIIQLYSCFPAHILLCQAPVILIILFILDLKHFSFFTAQIFPILQATDPARKHPLHLQIGLCVLCVPALPCQQKHLSYCIIMIYYMPSLSRNYNPLSLSSFYVM